MAGAGLKDQPEEVGARLLKCPLNSLRIRLNCAESQLQHLLQARLSLRKLPPSSYSGIGMITESV